MTKKGGWETGHRGRDRGQRTGEMGQRMADKGYRGRETGDWRPETGDRERETGDRGSGQGTDDRGQRTKCFDPKRIEGLALHLNQYFLCMRFWLVFQKLFTILHNYKICLLL